MSLPFHFSLKSCETRNNIVYPGEDDSPSANADAAEADPYCLGKDLSRLIGQDTKQPEDGKYADYDDRRLADGC